VDEVAVSLTLTRTERRILLTVAEQPDAEGRRARAILLLADGASYRDVCATLGCHADFVYRWRVRFEAERIDGLRTRPSRPYHNGDDMAARVRKQIEQAPPDGMARWTSRTLGRALNLPHTAVARILKREGYAMSRAVPWRGATGIADGDTADLRARLEPIWEKLLEFGAADVDAALGYALGAFGDLVNAHDGYWLGAVRVGDPDDPLGGWRPRAFRDLPAEHERESTFRRFRRDTDRTEIDESTLLLVRDAGQFRALRLQGVMPPAWFESPYFDNMYGWQDIVDAIIVVAPVGTDAESYWGWHRHKNQGSFTDIDRDRLAAAVRGIGWIHRRLMLSYGLLAADTPLTPSERRVLRLLLTDLSEKEVADRLELGVRTTHHHATTIYRKFGVRGRTGLMALWLGEGLNSSNPG